MQLQGDDSRLRPPFVDHAQAVLQAGSARTKVNQPRGDSGEPRAPGAQWPAPRRGTNGLAVRDVASPSRSASPRSSVAMRSSGIGLPGRGWDQPLVEVVFRQVAAHALNGGGVHGQGGRMLGLPVAPVAPERGMADARRQAGEVLLLPAPPRLEPVSGPGQLLFLGPCSISSRRISGSAAPGRSGSALAAHSTWTKNCPAR